MSKEDIEEIHVCNEELKSRILICISLVICCELALYVLG